MVDIGVRCRLVPCDILLSLARYTHHERLVDTLLQAALMQDGAACVYAACCRLMAVCYTRCAYRMPVYVTALLNALAQPSCIAPTTA